MRGHEGAESSLGGTRTGTAAAAALTVLRGDGARRAVGGIPRGSTRMPDPPGSNEGRGGRLIIVANRLPMTLHVGADGARLAPSAGGLATGLGGVHWRRDSTWVGWSGAPSEESAGTAHTLEQQLRAHGAVDVPLTAAELDGFYRRYANGLLWPVLHGLPEAVMPGRWDWHTYQTVNARFAHAAALQVRSGDRVWIHDYHLLLVPKLLRAYHPTARIGFFLHTPFPGAASLGRLRPDHLDALLDGLLGADLIGFHTAADAARFAHAIGSHAQRTLAVSCALADRGAGAVGVFPMGIDAEAFAARAGMPRVPEEVGRLRRPGSPLFVGVDRLDYTKGIPERLAAFERLLERMPSLCGSARLFQLAVPSREDVPAYRALRTRVEALVHRINTRFRRPGWEPIEYLYGSVDSHRLAALYRAADVMLVTPLRDGMNLVAKEFVASRTDEDGVLVLSEHAGAASELRTALQVDPSDVRALVDVLAHALEMSPAERRVRMRRMRAVVMRHDVFRWSDAFLAGLDRAAPAARSSHPES